MAGTSGRSPRHILLYGPPAAGKQTVAHEVVKRYGLRLLDNHATVDLALRLFDFGAEEFGGLVERLRLELITTAARAGLDVVSTLVFAHPVDRAGLSRLVDAARDAGATVSFVQLRPARAVLEERVTSSSRAGTRKIRDLDSLRGILDRHDLVTPINPDDLSIDNTDLPPAEAARLIARQVGLEER